MEYNEGTPARVLRRLSSNALKLTACVCMAVDHIGIVFMDNNYIMRAVGRLAFPVFAFLLVQGLLHTSDVRGYLLRLGIFAVVSEIPFDLAMHDTIWYPGAQNIFFTLTAGLFAIYAMDSRGPIGRWKVEIALAAALLAEFLRFDYGMAGVGIIVMFYLIEKERSGADAYTLAYFNKKQNIEIVKIICKELGKPESLITHVTDRKGHDMRYAIDPTKIHNELGWLPETKFADGIKKTIKWYLENREWWETIISGEYQNYYEKMYGNREEV